MEDHDRSPRVVVTGATGWLGRRLVGVLQGGLSSIERFARPDPGLGIRCLALPADEHPLPDGVEVVRGDLRDPEACRALLADCSGCVVYHTAAVIHPRRVREFFEVNVGGTQNLLAAATAAGAKRVVVVSSNSPMGYNSSRDGRFDESSPYRPSGGYGRSKMVMEEGVARVQRAGRVETVVLRAPWFYGPHQPARQTLFFEMIRDGRVPIVGDGENLRSMVYLDNLCQGLLLAAAAPRASGETYWVADEHPYTMNQIVDMVERLLEQSFGIRCAHRRIRLPAVTSRLAELMDRAMQGVGLYQQKLHVLSEMNQTIACTIDKAKEELGYTPTVQLEEGMRRSITWCLEQGLLRADRNDTGAPPSPRQP